MLATTLLLVPLAAPAPLPPIRVAGPSQERERERPRPASDDQEDGEGEPAAGDADGESPQQRRGLDLPSRPGGDFAPRSPGRRPRLQLPPGPRDPAPKPAASGPKRVDASAPARPPLASDADSAAAFVFEELARVGEPNSSLARRAVESLLAMGEDGLAAARARTSSEDAAVLATAARVLLRGGTVTDRRLVVERLRVQLPSSVAQPLLHELVQRDPVLATSELFTELLSHPTGAMRSAAARELSDRLDARLLPALSASLRASRADTRLRALTLVASVPDAGALPLVVERLGDGSAKVAARAAELLAAREEPALDELLRSVAFEGAGPFDAGRKGAYALLALVQREQRKNRVLLTDEDVPRLLQALASREPLTSVTAAIALAGVGFRSPRASEYDWLDLEVPHALVRWGSGAEFHTDFSSVHELALRRVALLSGEPFGQDGPSWRRWWTEAAGRFTARRAVLPVDLSDAPALALTLREGLRAEDTLVVLGPAASVELATSLGRTVYVDVQRCEELFQLLEREGVFGPERLPAGAAPVQEVSTIDVDLGDHGKLLARPNKGSGAWFERLASTLEALEEDNRWQRWFDPLEYTDQRTFWEESRARFAGDPDAPERLRREVELLLGRLVTFSRTTLSDDREVEILDALEQRFAAPGIARPSDFGPLLELLRAERYHGRRAQSLLSLALVAGCVPDVDDGAEAGRASLDITLARDLLEAVVQQEGPEVPAALGRIVEEQGLELARDVALGEDPRLRAIAAGALARSEDPDDQALFEVLLVDVEAEVEAAACRAAGDARLEDHAPALLVRARAAAPRVRAAALGALVALRHEESLELLRIALYEPELMLQQAAVEGLAALGDPAAAPMLARVLTRGPASPLFAPARAGLEALGDAATDELLVLANSAEPEIRREASLLLARHGVPEAFSLLLTTLTLDPDDQEVLDALAVLSCVDFRASSDPVESWWTWWDLVVHDDSRAWIAGAAEVADRPAPALELLQPGPDGTVPLQGALFLVSMLADERPHVVERVRRELSAILGRELELAEGDVARAVQRAELEAELRSR